MNAGQIITELNQLVTADSRVVVIGIGEPKMKDDGFGPFVVVELYRNILFGDQVPPNPVEFFKTASTRDFKRFPCLLLMNPSTTPENRIQEVIDFHPDFVFLIDTAELQEPPGSLAVVPSEKILNVVGVSTHTLPVPIFVDRLKDSLPNLVVKLIGVQPALVDGNLSVDYFIDTSEPYFEEFLTQAEQDEDLPFFAFELTNQIKEVGSQLARELFGFFHWMGFLK